MKLNKNPSAKHFENLVNLVEKNNNVCESAAGKMDQLKSEKIAGQKKLFEIHLGQAESVQETVKSEMKSWADIMKKYNNTQHNLT